MKFEADVTQIPDYYYDYLEAEEQLGREYDPATERWHHHQDGETMQLIDKKIHNRFTHEGGVATGNSPEHARVPYVRMEAVFLSSF